MTKELSEQGTTVHGSPFQELSATALAKTIFKAELPEQYVRTFPAQSLYLTIQKNGLGSSTDLLEIASVEQCRLIADFDLWDKDQLNEERLWEWLSLADEENGLLLLQKFIKFVDLKIIALLMSRYIEVVTLDEPTDTPPLEGTYTPDKGSTWIGIKTEDGTKHFLIARLLALVFETSSELFYQLLAIPSTHTQTVLEEDSYIDRQRRLTAEGVPDTEYAASLHKPLPDNELIALLSEKKIERTSSEIRGVEPIVYQQTSIEPIGSLLKEALSSEEVQSELTLIVNGAIVFFGVQFFDETGTTELIEKIKGALNIGLETALSKTSLTGKEILEHAGLQLLYRNGITHLNSLRTVLRGVTGESLRGDPREAEKTVLFKALTERPAGFPEALGANGKFYTSANGEISTSTRAIASKAEIKVLKEAW